MDSANIRVVIVTDSLGCPRRETKVCATWVDKILKSRFAKNFYFYTVCIPGLSSKCVPMDYLAELEPDIVILQVGIVDACRRVLGSRVGHWISLVPVVRDIVRSVSSRYHYQLTRLYNVHYASISDYERMIRFILDKTKAVIFFVPIAPAGEVFRKKIYNIDNEIQKYNSVAKKIKDKRLVYLNPYTTKKQIFISDGHHLNDLGIELVYEEVKEVLTTFGGCKDEI